MTLSQGMEDLSRTIHQAVDTAGHTVENVLQVGVENNPLYKEVSLLQQAATVMGTMDPAPLKTAVQEVDNKLHQCGLLPHLHLGLDDHNNPTLTLEKPAMKTDCFGYMHVPGFGDGQALPQGRQAVSHGHYEGGDNVNHDAGNPVDTVINGIGDLAKKAGLPDIQGHPHLGPGGDQTIRDAKAAVDTVINNIGDMARNAGFPIIPRT